MVLLKSDSFAIRLGWFVCKITSSWLSKFPLYYCWLSAKLVQFRTCDCVQLKTTLQLAPSNPLWKDFRIQLSYCGIQLVPTGGDFRIWYMGSEWIIPKWNLNSCNETCGLDSGHKTRANKMAPRQPTKWPTLFFSYSLSLFLIPLLHGTITEPNPSKRNHKKKQQQQQPQQQHKALKNTIKKNSMGTEHWDAWKSTPETRFVFGDLETTTTTTITKMKYSVGNYAQSFYVAQFPYRRWLLLMQFDV